MPVQVSYPGVYVEEIPSGVRTITGVATSITAFIGRALRGPVNKAKVINSFGDFERIFGGLWIESSLGYAVRDFYLNGGSQAVIVRLFHPFFEDEDDRANAKKAADAVVAVVDAATEPAKAVEAARTKADEFNNEPERSAADAVATAAKAKEAGSLDDVKKAAKEAAASATPKSKAELTVGGITLVAAYEGTWGQKLRATLDQKDISPEVAKAMGLAPDQLFNLTVADTSPGGTTERHLNLSVADGPRRVDRVLEAESRLVRATLDLQNRPQITIDDAKTKSSVDSITKAEKAVEKAAGELKVLLEKQPPPTPAEVDAAKKKRDDAQKALEATSASSDGEAPSLLDFMGNKTGKRGLYALEQVDLFNLLCIPPDPPGGNVDPSLIAEASKYCKDRRAMLLVDPRSDWKDKDAARDSFMASSGDYPGIRSSYAALFFPCLKQPNPLRDNQVEEFVPCGAVAGIFARTDTQRGVWKAPAGIDATLVGVRELSVNLTDAENGELNPLGINCLRAFPAAGRVVWGARTLRGADQLADEYKYIPVRRLALYIEESLYRGTQWVVFEPNDEPLWAQIRLNVGAFMHNLFRQGAFQGRTPRDAYFVKCDKETTTQNDINLGIVNIVVGFAPLKPAEFVIIKLQQIAGQIEV